MPVPMAALFASAIYLERSALAEPPEIARTVALLWRAANGETASFEVAGNELIINGTPLSLESPGATVVRHALVDHHTARLVLPPTLTAIQWHGVVELYASAPGLYATVDDLRDALRFTVPEAIVSGSSGAAAEGDLRGSLFELPGLRVSGATEEVRRNVNPHDAELDDLAQLLDPLLQAAARAREANDLPMLAQTLLQMQELASGRDAEQRAIIARERRRIIPGNVLDAMARLVPKSGAGGAVARALGAIGHDGAAALLDALGGAHSAAERRAYIDALVGCRDADATIIDALGSDHSDTVRDAAEVVGRKRTEQAVPVLSRLLRHARVDVRTTVWHALELIGTRDAVKALRS